MSCSRCNAQWCWICEQLINEEHYEMTWKNVLTGCPLMQFVNEGGSSLRFFAIIWGVWLLNIPVLVLIYALVAILTVIAVPYAYCNMLAGCFKKLRRMRRKHPCVKISIFMACILLAFLGYATFTYIFLALMWTIETLILALALLTIAPAITIFVPVYTVRILSLSGCRFR